MDGTLARFPKSTNYKFDIALIYRSYCENASLLFALERL